VIGQVISGSGAQAAWQASYRSGGSSPCDKGVDNRARQLKYP
jgi:hypothetical protein